MSEYEPDYADAAADQRERAAAWDDHERAWTEARQDALTRDAGERPGWPTHVERVRDAGYADDDPKAASVR